MYSLTEVILHDEHLDFFIISHSVDNVKTYTYEMFNFFFFSLNTSFATAV